MSPRLSKPAVFQGCQNTVVKNTIALMEYRGVKGFLCDGGGTGALPPLRLWRIHPRRIFKEKMTDT